MFSNFTYCICVSQCAFLYTADPNVDLTGAQSTEATPNFLFLTILILPTLTYQSVASCSITMRSNASLRKEPHRLYGRVASFWIWILQLQERWLLCLDQSSICDIDSACVCFPPYFSLKVENHVSHQRHHLFSPPHPHPSLQLSLLPSSDEGSSTWNINAFYKCRLSRGSVFILESRAFAFFFNLHCFSNLNLIISIWLVQKKLSFRQRKIDILSKLKSLNPPCV